VSIHSEDPFSVPVDQRDPVRRLRGRLAAPVTILTAQAEQPAGITVSSFFVVEGEVARTAALVGPGSDFLDEVETSGAFIAHVMSESQKVVADVFAGLRPSPGGMFASVETESTRWGPHLAEVGDWAGCRLEEVRPLGDQLVLVGEIEELAVTNLTNPLVYFRGSYRGLQP
jgi:3-hydroxy-9,10-secoandrosta-1,3,5(10)-triene-9,17-dione monooxygenase reductase component